MTKEDIQCRDIHNRLLHRFDQENKFGDERLEVTFPAMQEYADLRCKPLVRALNEIATGQRGELKAEFILRIKNLAEKALQDYNKK